MALTNYKSSQIVLNVPNKVLGTSISAVTGNAYWPHQNGTGDQWYCLLYTSPSPRDATLSRMPSSA